MRRLVSSAIPLAILFLSALPTLALAQEIELATYTPEQRWERAARHAALGGVSGIAYAKTMGQSVEAYAGSMADLFVPGWGEPGSGSLAVVRGMHRNFSLWPDCEFEIVEQSGTAVTVRTNRPWSVFFGEDETWYGVTVQEYETFFGVFNSRLADHLGLGYEEWTEGDWLYLTFSLGA